MKNLIKNRLLLPILCCSTIVACNSGAPSTTAAAEPLASSEPPVAAPPAAAATTVVCSDQAVGTSFNGTDGSLYRVMEDGAGQFGIKNSDNLKLLNEGVLHFCTSHVTDMSSLFAFKEKFNQAIGDLNTSKVTTMVAMFENASAFNQDLHLWNVASVSDHAQFNYNANSAWRKNASYQPVWK